jgi:hypothetical protein
MNQPELVTTLIPFIPLLIAVITLFAVVIDFIISFTRLAKRLNRYLQAIMPPEPKRSMLKKFFDPKPEE